MLEEKILNDYKEAMKARDSLRISVLSCLRAEIKNVEIAKNKNSLDDNEVVAVIKKQVKQRQDSIEQFKNGGRDDLADKEVKELKILEVASNILSISTSRPFAIDLILSIITLVISASA